MNTIICRQCGEQIEVDKALEGQIEARVLAAAEHRHAGEMDKIRNEAEANAKRTADALALIAQKEAAAEIEIVKKQMESEAKSALKKTEANQSLLIKTLTDDAESARQESQKLRTELGELMKLLREEKQAHANAELEAQKRLTDSEDKIRDEVVKHADEKYRLKTMEQEKKISDMQKSLDEAQRKAAQGSQQNQGEVLELDLENRLKEEFPLDEIIEVKKGARGADMKQIVHNQAGHTCGVLLWETKNGRWQPAWVAKFKQDIREANASIGVIVSQETPNDMGDLKHLESNVWVVSPKLATRLAAALRITILQVDSANKMSAGKDAKMEALYQFLVGPEFRHRVEAIVENYSLLQAEIEKEKRAAALRWAHQEKAIRAVIDNTIGMYGDLQGITNRALPAIKTLEIDEGENTLL